MKAFSLWEPIIKQEKPEPKALLLYGDTSFEIPYTLMHHLAGWLCVGCFGDVSMNDGGKRTIKALDFLASQMAWDANPPSKEDVEFYGAEKCARPELHDFEQAKSIYESIEEYRSDMEKSKESNWVFMI
jgi:hypothetical protein